MSSSCCSSNSRCSRSFTNSRRCSSGSSGNRLVVVSVALVASVTVAASPVAAVAAAPVAASAVAASAVAAAPVEEAAPV